MANLKTVLSDFQKRRNSPAGDLDILAQRYLQANWGSIEQSIKNHQTIYIHADTQSGKTRYKLALTQMAIASGLIDNVIISTTNLSGAMDQMFERCQVWAESLGMQVKNTDDKLAYMVKGDIFVNMTNAKRTNRIDKIVERAEEVAAKLNKPAPRLMVIIDEGEEFHEGTELSACDTALGNLLNSRTVSTVKVSATLLSHIMIHNEFANMFGYLTSHQIFSIPNHPDYKGLDTPNFIEPLLLEEAKFKSDTYTKDATLRNTCNPKIIVDAVDELITNSKMVQVGNIVLGRSQIGHLKVANLMERAFTNKGYTVTVWDKQDIHSCAKNEIVIIVHNGSAKDLSIANKLKQVAWSRIGNQPKAVLIISKIMTGKSITVECEDCFNINSPEFGYYCNFTAYYSSVKENVTTAIQAMRCTGIRPSLKKHVMWTTDETKQDIENYRDQIAIFISHLNQVGTMDKTQIIDWVAGQRPFAKGKVHKHYFATGKAKGGLIPNSDRGLAIESDMLIQISAAEHKALRYDVAGSIKLAVKHGFVPQSTDAKDWEIRQDATYANDGFARQAFTNHTNAKLVKLHWTKVNGKYHMYLINKMPGQTRVQYNITLDKGRPDFSGSKLFISRSKMLIKAI